VTRLDFTINIVGLLKSMIDSGEHPIIDYVKRSDEEQKRLFDAGKSKCDGVNNISGHQVGKAMDIYFIEDGKLVESKQIEYWHKLWENWGGKPEISWDRGHFEG
jgi:hypothetical protein